jgi:uncharacterized protein
MAQYVATQVSIADRITELLRPDAYAHPARDLRLIETHISWVILAGNHAYKLRKPVNYGLLDFSSVEQRRVDCEAEVRLNRRLCPDLYLGTLEVVERDGRLYMGGEGTPVEPAVWMQRLSDAGMLAALVERSAVGDRLMDRIASTLAQFHARAASGPGVDEYGSIDAIVANWQENFAQTIRLPQQVLPRETRAAVQQYVDTFIVSHSELFHRRQRQGCIRDGHGDLHAGSVCATRGRVYLFSCIEFNARFRCADVAADVAFLAMDLEHLGRADLSAEFVDAYIRHSGDQDLLELLDFYKCYCAFVRGKVLGFRLGQEQDSESIKRESRAYFDLAYSCVVPVSRPILLVTMGLPATGKSTLARAVASRCGIVHLSSDIVRKQLVRLRPTMHRSDGFERGLYSRSMTRRTYSALRRKAMHWLRRRNAVVLDATFGQPSERAALRLLARKTRARLLIVVCSADESIIKARLAAREMQRGTTSDARLDVWTALRASFVEPFEIPDAVRVDTAQPLDTCVEAVVSALRSTSSVSNVA